MWLFGAKKKKRTDDDLPVYGRVPDYEEAKKVAEKGNNKAKLTLADNPNLQPEFLYYFATDESSEVRQAVARNESTPLQADLILTNDLDDDVRVNLSRKIGSMMPNLSDVENEKVSTLVNSILDKLANDQASKVRQVLVDEIKAADNIPPRIARLLAEDVENAVANPMLQYSPVLTDKDLEEIIASGINSERLTAVANRAVVSENVSQAIVDTRDSKAVSTLLANLSAEISEATAGQICDDVFDFPDLQLPLTKRPGFSLATLKKIASVVSENMLENLIETNVLIDKNMASQLRESIQKRLGEEFDFGDDVTRINPMDKFDFGDRPHPNTENPQDLQVQQMMEAGKLGEKEVRKALIDGDMAFVEAALRRLGNIKGATMDKLLNSQNAKQIVTLAWRCKFSPRFAVDIQQNFFGLAPEKTLRPTADGNFPIPEEDMSWFSDMLD